MAPNQPISTDKVWVKWSGKEWQPQPDEHQALSPQDSCRSISTPVASAFPQHESEHRDRNSMQRTPHLLEPESQHPFHSLVGSGTFAGCPWEPQGLKVLGCVILGYTRGH